MTEQAIESRNHAFRIAALPTEWGDVRINQLMTRGYNAWETPDGPDRQALINAVEKFGNMALASGGDTVAEYVRRPSDLAVLATLAAITVEKAEEFQTIERWQNQPFADIQRLYTETLKYQLQTYEDPAVEQDLAEVLFDKTFSDHESYVGRLCTDVVHRPDLDSPFDCFLQFPVAAASQKCIIRDEDLPGYSARRQDDDPPEDRQQRWGYLEEADDDATPMPDGGTRIYTAWENNFLYVPVAALYHRFEEYMDGEGGAFERLVDIHKQNLSPEQHEWILANITGLQEQLAHMEAHDHYEDLYRNWEPGQKLVDVLTAALETADELACGEYYQASELYSALETYHPEENWQKAIVEKIDGPRGLGVKLTDHQDHSAIDVKEGTEYHMYKVGWSGGSESEIEVTELEDLLQLPCFAKMDQRLREEGPVRKDLYNLVRMAWWLPQYGDENKEKLIEDIKDLFSRWPWFDPHITESQARYELRPDNTITGVDGTERPPLPRNCNNGDMERYCIGRDVCPYTIYSSVPFRDEMYEVLEDLMEQTSSE